MGEDRLNQFNLDLTVTKFDRASARLKFNYSAIWKRGKK
jgi:hypothetical protein